MPAQKAAAEPIKGPKAQKAGASPTAKTASPGAMRASQAAGPAVGLGTPQKAVPVGKPGDAFEREADTVARRVASGQPAGAVSRLPAAAEPGSARRETTTPAPPAQRETEAAKPAPPAQREAKPSQGTAAPVVQRASVEEDAADEDPVTEEVPGIVQKAVTGPSETDETEEEAAARAVEQKGPGEPIEPETRRTLESRLGADLSGVRVHKDGAAQDAADALGARAFTYGPDIWLGRGESDQDVSLMAHEAAHVAQQGEAAQRVQRAAESDAKDTGKGDDAGDGKPVGDTKTGLLDPKAKTLTFEELPIPGFKAKDHRGTLYSEHLPLIRKKGYTRGNPDQRRVWKGQLKTTEIKSALEKKATPAREGTPAKTSSEYVFKVPVKSGGKPFLIGTLDNLAVAMTTPYWGGTSLKPPQLFFDVDHIVELQVANWAGKKDDWPNTTANMELLENGANRSSGSQIAQAVQKKIQDFIAATKPEVLAELVETKTAKKDKPKTGKGEKDTSKKPAGATVNDIKDQYDVVFTGFKGSGGSTVSAEGFWKQDQIEKGDHLAAVEGTTLDQIQGEGGVLVFPGEAGGVGKTFTWGDGDKGPLPPDKKRKEHNWLAPLTIVEKTFETGEGKENSPSLGTLWVEIPAGHPTYKPLARTKVDVERIAGARYAGFLSKQKARSLAEKLEQKHASPIRIDEFDIVPEVGLYARGQLLPDVPLIKDAGIQLELRGDELRIFKTFKTGDFAVPKPLTVTDSSLTLSISTTKGLGIEGQVDFGIEKLGDGYLRASVTTGEGFALGGHFSFDSTLFDPADVDMKYEKNVFSIQGHLGIKEGKVRGIRSADITVSYSDGRFAAAGSVKPNIPGVEQGDLTLSYSETEGFAIGASLQLKKDLPGIRSGSVEVRVERPEGAERYKISAHGKAEPAIPGVKAALDIIYDDGAFTAEATAAYEKGLLKGSLTLGVTNRAVDDSGQPAGEPGAKLTAFGGGTVTIRITPWLQGTAGVTLLPNGEIVITGEIGLPDVVEIFPAKNLEKNIFTIGIDIPIVGLAVAGQRVGIFATISGGLTASAGIGPGQLRELKLSVTYNPDHEDQTRVAGRAELNVPAHAGLRLFVRGALGAGIPLVSATAGLEIGGQLGLEGAARAGVQVEWTPGRGLVLDAAAEIFVEPKFRFDITGFVLVELDIVVKTITLYEKRWELAAFEYGSGLRFGVRFPVHYEEGKPFDLSLSNLQFIVPDVDPKAVLTGLIGQLA